MVDGDILSKFTGLMEKERFSESDLELIQLGASLGLDLVSFEQLRISQEEDYNDEIRQVALNKMHQFRDNRLPYKDYFYAGSIDFMVCEEQEGKRFFLLETNGGSNRGLSIITKKQQGLIFDGYFEAINQAFKYNHRGDNKLLVLVGVPVEDGLIHEKVMMLEYMRKKLKIQGKSVAIYNLENYKQDFSQDIAFLIADYKQLSGKLAFSGNWVMIRESKISVLIGDGIARRLQDDTFSQLIRENFRKIKTIIINPVFRITDDKALTYLASFFAKEVLEKYGLKYLLFTQARDDEDLINKIKYLLEKYRRPFIIKPNGGSGGAGVIPLSPELIKSREDAIKNLIKQSKEEFFKKFMRNRNPFPYTIQEMADFSLINWKNSKHTFDLRIYLAQKNDEIIPIGGLARIARGIYEGSLNKQEFVVNLSGYEGQIEVERGRGISRENGKLLNLNRDDFVNIFSIGCVLFVNIIKNYKKIMNFSNWDKILGE